MFSASDNFTISQELVYRRSRHERDVKEHVKTNFPFFIFLHYCFFSKLKYFNVGLFRPDSFGLETVKETVIVPQAEVDDNDDKTIRFSAEPAILRGTTIFDGFGDFNLDLSCLSSPSSSPTASTSVLPPPDSPSPPSSPVLSRSASFISRVSPLPQKKKSKKKLSLSSSPHLGATTGSATALRGSWPLIKYAGRGTPIDRNRRLEWGGGSGGSGGFSGEEEVAEDGLLFSAVRSTSLDSAVRPSQWSHISAISSSHSHTASSESTSRGDDSAREQPPELAPILIEGLGADKFDEWDSIMKTVLAPSSTEVPPSDLIEEVSPAMLSPAVPAMPAMPAVPHKDSELEAHGLEIDLGLNAALDLGLGQRGGMNWFDLGLLPKSRNGDDTPSVYSSRAATPRLSPPPSVRRATDRRRSTTTSTKSEDNDGIMIKTDSHPWWRRFLLRMRKVQSLMTVHKSRF